MKKPPPLKLGVPAKTTDAAPPAATPDPLPDHRILDDADADAASTKELRNAYRELRTLFQARLEELIGKRVEEALRSLRAEGKQTGGHRPLGFVVGEDRVLAPDKEERKIMKIAKQHHAEGLSLRKIARRLEEQGFVARNKKRFEAAQVKRLIERADTLGDQGS